MAAAEYYGTGPSNGLNDRFDSPSPPSASDHHSKPLPTPYQGAFPPTHSGGYNDDLSYASNHYHKQSIDTSYDRFSCSSQNQASTPSKHESQYADNIPLQDTHHRPSISAAEGGGLPPDKRQKCKSPPPTRRPWFCYVMTLIHIGVFCGQLAKSARLTGSPIATSPFNPMIGPDTNILVNMGARYVPCMKYVEGFKDLYWPEYLCKDNPNKGTSDDSSFRNANRTNPFQGYSQCTMQEVCGFGGHNVPKTVDEDNSPNQWYRFMIPMFLHAGVVHLAFNMLLQIILGGDIERVIGPVRFALIYFASGIFGFVLGGTLEPKSPPSVGASGCLFSVFALVLLDILYTWNTRQSPVKDLLFLLLDIAISFVLGLLPFIDNFAHMGGFVCGLALGLVFMDSPERIRQRIGLDSVDPPYTRATPGNPYNSSSGNSDLTGFRGFLKQPVGFFKGRKPAWWAWWLVRAAMLAITLIALVIMLNNFYKYHKECKWCRFLNCMPINGWCDDTGTHITIDIPNGTDTSAARLKRSIGMAGMADFF